MQPSAEVQRLAREMFEVTTRRSPAWATDLGLHTWDHEVGDPSRARVLEDITLHQGWLARADRIAEQATRLPPAERVDLAALRYSLRLWLHEETVVRQWERNPDLAMGFLDHVFGLLVKEELPAEARCSAIAARLEKAGWYLEAGRDGVRGVPRLWVDIALESAQGAPAMLEAAEQLALRPDVSAATRERVRAGVKRAREGFRDHEAWLLELRARAAPDGWAIGAENFRRTVDLRLLGADDGAILATGERLVRELRDDTRRAAEALVGKAGQAPRADPVQQAQELIEAEHPRDWKAVLEAYRESIAAARGFVERHGIADLPPGERLEVIETPAYLRHIMPFAAYVSPGKFEARQVGFYMVTPREPERFPWAEVLNTTVHEGYPGHHVQLTGANRNPSTARLFVHAVETIEGWAHYCEELMLASGFGLQGKGLGSSPEAVRYVVLKDQLWRACRIVIDVRLHGGGMGFDEAVAMLRDVARMGEPQATAEVKRYTQSPAYQLSYLWGKLGIQKLRDAAQGRGMATKAFHDRYIRAGSLPLALMAEELGLAAAAV
jgi:uncharacterized protein (DUF885 family)